MSDRALTPATRRALDALDRAATRANDELEASRRRAIADADIAPCDVIEVALSRARARLDGRLRDDPLTVIDAMSVAIAGTVDVFRARIPDCHRVRAGALLAGELPALGDVRGRLDAEMRRAHGQS